MLINLDRLPVAKWQQFFLHNRKDVTNDELKESKSAAEEEEIREPDNHLWRPRETGLERRENVF